MEFARAKFLVFAAQECESQGQVSQAIANYNDAARIFQGLVNNLVCFCLFNTYNFFFSEFLFYRNTFSMWFAGLC